MHKMGENRFSGLESGCFRLKRFAGGCLGIVRELCKIVQNHANLWIIVLNYAWKVVWV